MNLDNFGAMSFKIQIQLWIFNLILHDLPVVQSNFTSTRIHIGFKIRPAQKWKVRKRIK